MLNTQVTRSNVAVIVCNSCKAYLHCPEFVGEALPSKRRTILMVINMHLTCSDVVIVVCHTCKAHLHCPEYTRKTLPWNFDNAQPKESSLAGISQTWSLRWSCVTNVRRISTAQHPSDRLCRQISTTPNGPYDGKYAFNTLGRCGDRV